MCNPQFLVRRIDFAASILEQHQDHAEGQQHFENQVQIAVAAADHVPDTRAQLDAGKYLVQQGIFVADPQKPRGTQTHAETAARRRQQ